MKSAAIRFLQPHDIPAVLQIQHSSAEAAQWPQSAYEDFGQAGKQTWVAECDGHLAGFLVARSIAGEMEVLNLAVDAALRRKGIGGALLREALSCAAQHDARRIILEVRASNVAARAFYAAHGFASVGVRANYYSNPVEDALLLALNLDDK